VRRAKTIAWLLTDLEHDRQALPPRELDVFFLSAMRRKRRRFDVFGFAWRVYIRRLRAIVD
jgi:hypothetical protein